VEKASGKLLLSLPSVAEFEQLDRAALAPAPKQETWDVEKQQKFIF